MAHNVASTSFSRHIHDSSGSLCQRYLQFILMTAWPLCYKNVYTTTLIIYTEFIYFYIHVCWLYQIFYLFVFLAKLLLIKESRIKIILQVHLNSNKNTQIQISQLVYHCNNNINDWVIFAIGMKLEASLAIPKPSIPHVSALSMFLSGCLPSEPDSGFIRVLRLVFYHPVH